MSETMVDMAGKRAENQRSWIESRLRDWERAEDRCRVGWENLASMRDAIAAQKKCNEEFGVKISSLNLELDDMDRIKSAKSPHEQYFSLFGNGASAAAEEQEVAQKERMSDLETELSSQSKAISHLRREKEQMILSALLREERLKTQMPPTEKVPELPGMIERTRKMEKYLVERQNNITRMEKESSTAVSLLEQLQGLEREVRARQLDCTSMKLTYDEKLEQISKLTMQLHLAKKASQWKPEDPVSNSVQDFAKLISRLDAHNL